MTDLSKRMLCATVLAMMSLVSQAQLNITEYYTMNNAFSLEFKNATEEKNIYTKGVLDIRFDAERKLLAITYDPYQTSIKTAMQTILEHTGGEIVRFRWDEDVLLRDIFQMNLSSSNVSKRQ